VDTSMRKTDWYSQWHLLWLVLRMTVCPWLVMSRKQCRMWYDRPARGQENR